jgi:uncharacterized protein
MRIAIDIDSTLHHYWDQLAAVAERRFGVVLPYEEQETWGIHRLAPEQLQACVAETHREHHVLSARPYPGAVGAIARWHEHGHFIHITSHRTTEAHPHTERWLNDIGLPFDDLHCSYDKIARCRELGIDVLIDDSPVNLQRAVDVGIVGATISHPWNRRICDAQPIVCAPDWRRLARALDERVLGTRSAA